MSPTAAEAPATIVTLTPIALKQLQQVLSGQYGVRIGVLGGGCAGLQYQMDPCEGATEDDVVQSVGDGEAPIHLVINPAAVPYLQGLTIDYSTALVDGGFKFVNPNATSTCSCGTSFGV